MNWIWFLTMTALQLPPPPQHNRKSGKARETLMPWWYVHFHSINKNNLCILFIGSLSFIFYLSFSHSYLYSSFLFFILSYLYISFTRSFILSWLSHTFILSLSHSLSHFLYSFIFSFPSSLFLSVAWTVGINGSLLFYYSNQMTNYSNHYYLLVANFSLYWDWTEWRSDAPQILLDLRLKDQGDMMR